ncbi:MAG: hypothetical protein V4585_06810 [Bacteroidota bacterium]
MDFNNSIKKFNLSRFGELLLCILIITVFAIPRALQEIKISLLTLLLVSFIISKNIKIIPYKIPLIYGLLFIPSLFIGFLNGNNLAFILDVVRISFIFPLLLLLVFQQFNFEQLNRIFKRGILISILLILIIFLSSILNAFNLFPYNFNQFFYPKEEFVGIHDGYLHVINSSLSYLIFIIPFFFFGKEWNLKNYKIYLFFILLIVALISGRRILLLPIIIVLIFHLRQIAFPILIILFLSFLLIDKDVFSSFSIEAIIDRFKDALEEQGDSESRGEQSKYFIKYILESPITGYGLGSYMHDYLRSEEMPIAYEKTYYYLFFSMGIPIGLLQLFFYGILIIKTFKRRIFDESTGFRNAIIVSIISILIASNTNPYWLSSFDYCLPLSLLMRVSQNDNP